MRRCVGDMHLACHPIFEPSARSEQQTGRQTTQIINHLAISILTVDDGGRGSMQMTPKGAALKAPGGGSHTFMTAIMSAPMGSLGPRSTQH